MRRRRARAFPLFLLVADPPGLGLRVPDLPQVKPDSSGGERVGFRLAAVLLIGGAEAADESVEAAPGLPERAGAGGRGAGVPVKRADWGVDFRLPELIQVPEKF